MSFEQVLQQSREHQAAAEEITRFHLNNFQKLSAAESARLDERETEIREISRRLLNEAAAILWEDLQGTLKNIREATDKMRSVRAHLKSVQRTLSFAAAVIGLGGAILSQNPIAVATSALGVVDLVNTFRDEDDEEDAAEEDAVG
jgi:hypothetical protein